MTVAQLIQALQDFVEENEDIAYRLVRREGCDGYLVNDAYVDSDFEGDPVVVIY